MADARVFFRGIRRSVFYAALVLAWDVVLNGSCVMSLVCCPIWILASLLKSGLQRPGWRLALVRVGIPALTLAIARANSDAQLGIARVNAQRVVAACEQYQAAHGAFPMKLGELVPRYLDSVPRARYCVGQPGEFLYINSRGGAPLLVWQVIPPHLRRIYNFQTRSWSYLE